MEATTSSTAALGELHLHRLLVAVDGSNTSELALSAAVTAARRDNAAITLLAVTPDFVSESRLWTTGMPDPATLQAEADTDAQRLLSDTVERMPEDIPVTKRLRHGKAGPEIVAQAREHDYDAILLGARGVGRVGAALVGSVSSYVMHHADTAVFVAHAPRQSSD
jgi:nucleotide-binding universal stress UspA family protein